MCIHCFNTAINTIMLLNVLLESIDQYAVLNHFITAHDFRTVLILQVSRYTSGSILNTCTDITTVQVTETLDIHMY